MKLYSMAKLAKEVMVSPGTLRRWRQRGWLRPQAVIGTQERFTLEAFEEACRQSLQPTQPVNNDPSIYEKIARGINN